jgi:hypothetical protein
VTHHYKIRLTCHWGALVLETGAGFFIFMEAVRVDAVLSLVGYFGFDGEPVKYHGWYYHSGLLGFLLLILGILVSGLALVLEHRELAAKPATQMAPSQTPKTSS